MTEHKPTKFICSCGYPFKVTQFFDGNVGRLFVLVDDNPNSAEYGEPLLVCPGCGKDLRPALHEMEHRYPPRQCKERERAGLCVHKEQAVRLLGILAAVRKTILAAIHLLDEKTHEEASRYAVTAPEGVETAAHLLYRLVKERLDTPNNGS